MPNSRFEFRIVYPNMSPVAISVPILAEGTVKLMQAHYVRHGRDVVGFFSSDMRVKDVQRYTICWSAGQIVPCLRANGERTPEFMRSSFRDRIPDDVSGWPARELPQSHPSVGSHTVLLLLESPHIKEYGGDAKAGSMSPIAPAQGATGTRIKTHFADVLQRSDLTRELCGHARVIVANPIPYQASLGSILDLSNISVDKRPAIKRRVRDSVWEALWNMEKVRRDFEERLLRYAPGVVINACTRALSNYIAVFVAKHCPNSRLYETTHPSSWINQNHRYLKHLPL